MFSNRKWMQFALILNLLGSVALFYSFQATSSNIKLVSVKTNSALGSYEQSALCVYGKSMMTATQTGGWTIGGGPCPDWEHAKAAAVVNIEHPALEGIGFLLLVAGFLMQYLAVPQPKTIAQMRAELKLLKLEQRERSDS